jgi:hypothetical protein
VWFRKRDFRRITRGLRFRLTASYALFFSVLLIGAADLFRERLATALDDQVHGSLEQDRKSTRLNSSHW